MIIVVDSYSSIIFWNIVKILRLVVTMVRLDIVLKLYILVRSLSGSLGGPTTQGILEPATQLVVFMGLETNPSTAPPARHEAVLAHQFVRLQVHLGRSELAIRRPALKVEVHDLDGLLGYQVADPIIKNLKLINKMSYFKIVKFGLKHP